MSLFREGKGSFGTDVSGSDLHNEGSVWDVGVKPKVLCFWTRTMLGRSKMGGWLN